MSCRNKSIRIDKSSDLRIIITALEVVEPRLRIEIVTAVEKGIERTGDIARIGVSLGGKQIAPCVIEIGNAQIAVRFVPASIAFWGRKALLVGMIRL